MEKINQNYLERLLEWGERIKEVLQEGNFSHTELNEWTAQIESWQEQLKEQLQDDRNDPQGIQELKEEGKRILKNIKGEKQPKDHAIPFGKHTLPKLPYRYDALEPYISEEIMRLHHDKHHQSYVDGLNKAEEAIYTNKKEREPLKHWLRDQAFHGSGHYLHTIFWDNMTPNSRKKPSGELLSQMESDFGSWKNFKELFSDVANSVEGNGWAVLLWEPRSGRLAVQSFEKHQLFHLPDTLPLLVLDVWEHAYYLQYKNDKKSYIENWWNVVNWDNVEDRWKEAKKVKWTLY